MAQARIGASDIAHQKWSILEQIIGLVAGAGPYAGMDLFAKILGQTQAVFDQDHLSVISLSAPSKLADRTQFLMGETTENPAYAIAAQLAQLERAGAAVAGIPCNTAHAPRIYDVISRELSSSGARIKFLHMIEEVASFMKRNYPEISRVGVLSTLGTYRSNLYPDILGAAGFELLAPPLDLREGAIHQAIYHPDYGIKSCGVATSRAREGLLQGAEALRKAGAEAVILGCTEIPIAISERRLGELVVIDPTLILARALIREAEPSKLRPWID